MRVRRFVPVVPGLAALAARRALGPGALAALAVLLVLCGWSARRGEFTDPSIGDSLGRGRAEVWTVGLALALPWLALQGASAARELVGRGGSWARARGASGTTLACSTLAGLALAAALWTAVIACAAECFAAGGRALALERRLDLAPAFLGGTPDATSSVRWTLDDGVGARAGGRVSLAVVPIAGAGPAARATLRARRGSELAETRALVAARAKLEVELPSGTGPIELELDLEPPGAGIAVPPGACAILVPVDGEHSTGWRLALHALVAAAAAVALGFACGSWMRPPVATCLALALLLAGADWGALAGLPEALELAQAGLAAPYPGIATLLQLAALAAGCAWTAARGSSARRVRVEP